MDIEGSETWVAIFGRTADLSLQCRLRSRWNIVERSNGQRSAGVAPRHADLGIWRRPRRDRGAGERLAAVAPVAITRIALVPDSDRNRHAQLALGHIIGGNGWSASRTQT